MIAMLSLNMVRRPCGPVPRESPTRSPRFAARLACLAAVGTLVGCAGYQFGNRSLYPANIHTIYVPMIESDSLRRDLGERLTEAVVKQIELKTPFKVVGPTRADSILTARITADDRRLQVQTLNEGPRELTTTLHANVTWTTSQGQLLTPTRNLPVPDSMVEIGQSVDFVPEVGQSVATNQQRAIDKLAEQIVGMMELPWYPTGHEP